MPHYPTLTADRARHLCDEDGILPAISAAMQAGRLTGYDSPEHYLEAVLEGETNDEIRKFGWAPCPCPRTCTRNGHCRRGRQA
jgi:hypothetical protein